jgi:hypothetical protein
LYEVLIWQLGAEIQVALQVLVQPDQHRVRRNLVGKVHPKDFLQSSVGKGEGQLGLSL